MAIDGIDVTYVSDLSCDPSGNCATGSLTISLDQAAPTVVSAALTSPISVSTATILTLVGTDGLPGVAEAEFFIGADPGVGAGTPMLNEGDATYRASVGDELSAGLYAIGARVRDLAGNWSDTVSSELVVFDPGAGFVTGGGWSDSPPASGPDEPDALGRTSFGFASKYRSEATVPIGEFEFQFHSADINFHSTSLEWMTVAGNEAILQAAALSTGTDCTGLESGSAILLTRSE